MQTKILVPMMDGFEEIELVSIVDVLRRAMLDVAIIAEKELVTGTHNIVLKTDYKFNQVDINDFSAIVLAGGYDGMINLSNNPFIIKTLEDFNTKNKLIAAICASTIVLDKAGVLKNTYACYPGCEESIKSNAKYVSDEIVVVDNNIITSIGPASASLFAIEIVRFLLGNKIANDLTKSLLIDKVYNKTIKASH